MEHQIILQEDFILADCSGSYDFEYLKSLILIMKSECESHQLHKVACDLRRVTNLFTGENSEMERFYIGEEIAFQLVPDIKLAFIAQKEVINYFAQTVARTRGAQFKISSDTDDSLEWLLENKLE